MNERWRLDRPATILIIFLISRLDRVDRASVTQVIIASHTCACLYFGARLQQSREVVLAFILPLIGQNRSWVGK